MQQTVQVSLEDSLIDERDHAELEASLKQGLILLDYLSAKISIGRFAKLMGMGVEQARDWLHRRGIATLRRFKDPELEAAYEANYRDLEQSLGLSPSTL